MFVEPLGTFDSARSIVQWSAVCLHKQTNKDHLPRVTCSTSLEICSQRTGKVISYMKTLVNTVALAQQTQI